MVQDLIVKCDPVVLNITLIIYYTINVNELGVYTGSGHGH